MKAVKLVFAALLLAVSTVAFGQTATFQLAENEAQKLPKQGKFQKAEDDKGLGFAMLNAEGNIVMMILIKDPKACKVGKVEIGDTAQVFYAGNNAYGMERLLSGSIKITKKEGNKISGSFEGFGEGDGAKGTFTNVVLEEVK